MPDGFYSTPDDGPATNRVNQSECQPGWYCTGGVRRLCPGGVYGNATGLTSSLCSGTCSPGYFCTAGATVADQTRCGNVSVYCPVGSSGPLTAPGGVFTVGGDETTRADTTTCPIGHYCVGGTARGCPMGRFGCATGLSLDVCNGECAAGYYCPEASNSSHAVQCGGAAVYCPSGSGVPIPVDVGYYSLGGTTAAVQSAQALCPLGSFCISGVKVRRWLRPVWLFSALLSAATTSCRGFHQLCMLLMVGRPDAVPTRSIR